MDLNIGDILVQIARELHQNGSPIVLQWNTLSGGTLPDPVGTGRCQRVRATAQTAGRTMRLFIRLPWRGAAR